jgi:arabinofuranosyltransferase
VLLAGTVTHCLAFPRYVRPVGIGVIPVLRELGNEKPALNWQAMGLALRRDLAGDPDVTIGVSPAGAIPYFSRARTIDMLGLNDEWVARHGIPRRRCVVCAGHSRVAQIEYLERQRVNLLIGQPQLVGASEPVPDAGRIVRQMYYDEDVDYASIPGDARLVRIPLDADVALAAVYLAPNAAVDRLLQQGVWRAQPLTPPP